MPIYEYRCTKCGAEFEQIQKFSDPPIKKCRTCPGTVEKLISRSAFQLKGTGWYITDYARKGGGGSSGGSSSGGSSGGSKGGDSGGGEPGGDSGGDASSSKKTEAAAGPAAGSKKGSSSKKGKSD